MKKKILSLLVAASMLTFGLTACGGTETETAADPAAEENQDVDAEGAADQAEQENTSDLSGTISLAGSTSMEKLCEALSESFMEKYPNITVTVEYTG